MVRMTVLASGSRGNSTVVSTAKTRLLVDAGLSCRELMKRMASAGEDPHTLDGIVITHEHQDHVQGLAVLARKLGVPVYFTEATHRAWMRWMVPQKRVSYADWLAAREKQKADAQALRAVSSQRSEAGPSPAAQDVIAFREELCEDDAKSAKAPEELTRLPGVEYFRAGEAFCVGDIEVFPFTIPHDAVDPVGFVFQSQGIRVAVATDLGYMPPNAKAALRKCDVLMIESNHDLEMLRDGPYPWSVKQRVMSRVGHLSNHALAEYLTSEYDGAARYVVLAHLSESNNLPELARLSAENALDGQLPLLGNRVLLARQDAPLESLVL
jgi:phosphoribosyl 1,2-cyclic phosphodiesterase